jgi:hypothetical protein
MNKPTVSFTDTTRTFALALFDIFGGTEKTVDQVRKTIAGIQNEQLRKALLPVMDGADNLAEARANVESWFNDAMERVSGWYKRKAQTIILLAALALRSTPTPSRSPRPCGTTPRFANRWLRRPSEQPLPDDIEVVKQQLTELPLPLGWHSAPDDALEWLTKIVGLLITALALSLGAPFWFDALNKLVRVRDSGRSPDTSSGSKAEAGAGS